MSVTHPSRLLGVLGGSMSICCFIVTAESAGRLRPSEARAVQSPAASTAPRENPRDGLTYVHVPRGEFQMGCSTGDADCHDNEKPSRRVILSRDFWLGESEVTQAAYEKVSGTNPSNFKGPMLPVESVNWHEAARYCAAIGGRLPTEAEWEYAARAGSITSTYGVLKEIAWYGNYATSNGQTKPVKQHKPNKYGLYDMLGNVWEWTADGYADAIPSGVDPRIAPRDRLSVKGGSWFDIPQNLRVSRRDGDGPLNRSSLLGFRCASDSTPDGMGVTR